MRTTIQLLLSAALPAVLSAGTIPIGLSTNPVVFSPSGDSTGTITIGSCVSTTCSVTGVSTAPLSVGYSLTSTGDLTYIGGPTLYFLSGNASTFSLTDGSGDSLGGSVTWDTARLAATTTDLDGTLTLSTVQFGSSTDLLALAAITAFGSLPTSGQQGGLDLIISCGTGPCIATQDPTGSILSTTLTFLPANVGSAVPEPGTLVLPGLVLGFLALRKRYGV